MAPRSPNQVKKIKSFKDARSVSLSCNMLSTLSNLASQKELQIFVTNYVFLDNNKKHNSNKTKKSNIKTLAGARD